MFLMKLLKLNLIPSFRTMFRNVGFHTKGDTTQLETIVMAFATYESKKRPSSDAALPLIIVHGLFGSKRNWNSISKVLNAKTVPQRKVIAVDCRNHGNSPHTNEHSYPHLAEDIKILVEKLNIEKAALLGYSTGGRVVMYFALKYPKFVEKLIVVETSPVSSSPAYILTPIIFTALKQVELPNNSMPLASARRDCDRQLASSIGNKDTRAFLLTNLTQGPSGNYIWSMNLKAIADNFSKNILAFPKTRGFTFDCPVLFISGETSNYIPEEDIPKILKKFPKAEFAIIKESGHWVHIDKPVEFLKICSDFLSKK
ncbi:hypothetical protein ILUMI_25351 [Ignelater luminosus]|uniref:sn-1-specific diacylglycerol lipase ABHD11 n=1 Tax=Ignelater luminosus TaxID=2038154 RepID=A0A8K0CA56_IGNLU|nr:hypothetical protein ILUMI_25351 [Ignelater luminosus]